MTGHQYRDLIASYIHHNYAGEGLVVYVEVSLGKTVIGNVAGNQGTHTEGQVKGK